MKKLFFIFLIAAFGASCGGTKTEEKQTESIGDSVKETKTEVPKQETKIKKDITQILWKSENYYGNGINEYILEEYPNAEPASKKFLYNTSKKQTLEILGVTEVVDNSYAVKFAKGNAKYRLVFKGDKMDCIDDQNKIQAYSKASQQETADFIAKYKP